MLTRLQYHSHTAPPHRPDWSRCADYYTDNGSDSADKWHAVAEDKSSDYLVDVLLAQIAGVDVSEIRKDDNFQSMVSRAVPLSYNVRSHQLVSHPALFSACLLLHSPVIVQEACGGY